MKTYTIPLALIGLGLFILAGILMMKPFYQAEGSAFTGGRTFLQIATTTAVGPQDGEDTVFASNETCNARVITTQGLSAIMISFGDKTNGDFSSTTLGVAVGHLQAASTTEVYDAGLYGCGRWTVYAWASSTLTVSEF